MNIKPCGIYQGTKIYAYKDHTVKVDKGRIKDNLLYIYNGIDNRTGNLMHRLYYLTDIKDNFIKSKLKFFSGRSVYKTLWSDRKRNDKA